MVDMGRKFKTDNSVLYKTVCDYLYWGYEEDDEGNLIIELPDDINMKEAIQMAKDVMITERLVDDPARARIYAVQMFKEEVSE